MKEQLFITARRRIGDLAAYAHNPRRLTKTQAAQLTASLKKFGLVEIPAVDADNTIIAGHQRLSLLSSLHGPDFEIDVRLATRKLTDKEFQEYNIRSNANTGEWDEEALANSFEAEDLKDWGLDVDFEVVDEAEDKDAEVEVPVNPISKLGDIWLCGPHRVMCGDATIIDDVEKLMAGKKADMVFTDPPYNVGSDSKNYAADVSKSMKDISEADWDKDFEIEPSIINAIMASSENATYMIWTSHFLIQRIWDVLNNYCDFTSYLVWNKPNPMPSLSKRHPTWNSELCVYGTRGSKRTVNFPNDGHFYSVRTVNKKSDGSHPTQKPIDLIIPLISFSSAKNDLVLDLFGGSGSTLIAAENTKRICYMMELSPAYCDVIVKRWQKVSGKDAILEETKQTFNQILNG